MESIYDKLRKIYELVNAGATDGERQAAKEALDRLVSKYNLDLSVIETSERTFRYSTVLENWLFQRLLGIMVPHAISVTYLRPWQKKFVSTLCHSDWILMECAYEYFRKHMKSQWNKVVLPEIRKKRKNKTKVRTRKELRHHFFTEYIIASKLYREGELKQVEFKSTKEAGQRLMMRRVEGGQYNKQIVGDKLLTQ